MSRINYEEALDRVLEHISPLTAENKLLTACTGQVLAENIHADYNLPSFTMASPDGYAVRSADISEASENNPVLLQVVGTARAGYIPSERVASGTAMRIMTGSPIPADADCVVPFEETDEPGNKNGPNPQKVTTVLVKKAVKAGDNIKFAGSRVKAGESILPQGIPIGPAQIAVLGSLGKSQVKVIRRPLIAIIATGDELVKLGESLAPGKVHDANSPALAALLSHYGAVPRILGIAKDNPRSLKAKLQRALTFADAIITSGGVSKGDYDLVRLLAGELGKVFVEGINMGPGASFSFAMLRRDVSVMDTAKISGETKTFATNVPLFGLSGPTVGCLNNFEILVRPALLKMMGHRNVCHPTVTASAKGVTAGKKAMSAVHWTQLELTNNGYRVDLSANDAGRSFAAIGLGDSLTIVPAGQEISEGDQIQVLPLHWTCL